MEGLLRLYYLYLNTNPAELLRVPFNTSLILIVDVILCSFCKYYLASIW